MKLLKYIIINNYIIDSIDGDFQDYSIMQGELNDKIFTKIKKLSSSLKNHLISLKYKNEEYPFLDFINNFCFDKNNQPTIDLNSITQIKLDESTKHYLKNIKLTKIPEYIKEFKKLDKLIIRNQNIKNLNNLKFNKNIIELDLRNNQIKNIEILENFKSLYSLFLSNNQIENVSSVFNLMDLNDLFLDENKIKSLPEENKLYQLKNLNLNNNQIIELKNKISSTKLERLNLQNNQIKNIDKDFFQGIGLNIKILNLNNNKLGDNEDINKLLFLQNLLNIEHLILSKNNLTENDFFSDKEFRFDKFSYLYHFKTNLKHLDLSNNKLKNLKMFYYLDFSENKNFTHLDLSNNKIRNLKNLDKFHYLNSLFINHNNIRTIEFLNKNLSLKTFKYKHNPFKYKNLEKPFYEYFENIREQSLIKDMNSLNLDNLSTIEERKNIIKQKLKIRKKRQINKKKEQLNNLKKSLKSNDNEDSKNIKNINNYESINFGF